MKTKIYAIKEGNFIELEAKKEHAARLGISADALEKRHVRKKVKGILLRGIYYFIEPTEKPE